ncbi:MAG: glycerophosphodiester phosphodiesterase, partial [Actinomycetota bacterium]
MRDPFVVAHRGASSTHPENTIAAFEAAIALGAPFVECDVRLSSDGVAVVIHDPTLERTTDGVGAVHERAAADLRRLNAGSAASPQRIPLLTEVLDLASNRAGLVLEIKNLPGEPNFTLGEEPIVEATLRALDARAFVGQVLVVSFNPASVVAARDAGGVAARLLLAGRDDPRAGLAGPAGAARA